MAVCHEVQCLHCLEMSAQFWSPRSLSTAEITIIASKSNIPGSAGLPIILAGVDHIFYMLLMIRNVDDNWELGHDIHVVKPVPFKNCIHPRWIGLVEAIPTCGIALEKKKRVAIQHSQDMTA